MKRIMRLLEEKSGKIDELHVPDDFKERMEQKLRDSEKSKIRVPKLAFVAMIFAVLFLGMINMNTLAFIGEEIRGYEELMSENMKRLNKDFKGQSINESYTFEDGREMVVEGVMVDDNKLMVYFKVGMNEDEYREGNLWVENIKFRIGEMYKSSGAGTFDPITEEVKWEYSFEGGAKFNKEAEFACIRNYQGKSEKGTVKFKIDKSKAMIPVLKKNIMKKIKLEDGTMTLSSISASPLSTVIKVNRKNIIEYAIERIRKTEDRIREVRLALFADGKEITVNGSSISTGMFGKEMKWEFEGIPESTKKIEIKFEEYKTVSAVGAEIEVHKLKMPIEAVIKDNKVKFEKIYYEGGNTFVTFISEDEVLLKEVSIRDDLKETELDYTSNDEYIKKNGKVYHRRTMKFLGDFKESVTLRIGAIEHWKKTDKKYEISVE